MARRTIDVYILGHEKDVVRAFKATGRAATKSAKTVDGTLSSISAGFKGLLSGGAISAATVGLASIGAGLALAVSEGRESIKVTADTAAVIKSMGGVANISAAQVAKLSEKLSMKAGIDDELIQSGQNLLLTFGNIRNEVGKGNNIFDQASATMVDFAARFRLDIPSAAKIMGKALNDPIKGLTSLSRAGVQFSEQQKAQIRTLVEAGDIMGAQKIILGELAKQTAGAAKAMATPMDRLKVTLSNLAERVGVALIPMIDKAAAWLSERLPGAIDKAAKWFNQSLKPAIADLVAWFDRNWPNIQKAIVITFQTIEWVWKNVGKPMFDRIKAQFEVLAGVVKTVTAIMHGDWKKAWEGIKQVFVGIWNFIVATLRPGLNILKSLWSAALGALKSLWRNAWNAIWGGLKSIWSGSIVPFFKGLPGRIKGWLAGAGRWLLEGGKNILRGMWRGIKDIWTDIIGWFKKLPGRILGILGIHSPPGWAVNAGRWIMKGIMKGVGLGVGNVMDFMGSIAGRFHGALADAWQGLQATLDVVPVLRGGGNKTNRAMGQQMARDLYGWTGAEWNALNALVMSESGWSNTAQNPTSTAYGIGQFLNSTWGSVGFNKTSDPATQIRAMLKYISQRYGDPLAAWAFKRSHNWYRTGGVVPGAIGTPQLAVVHGGEAVFRPDQARWLSANRGGGSCVVHVHVQGSVLTEGKLIEAINRGLDKGHRLGRNGRSR